MDYFIIQKNVSLLKVTWKVLVLATEWRQIIFPQVSLAIVIKIKIGAFIAHEGDAWSQQECIIHFKRITLDQWFAECKWYTGILIRLLR